MKMYVDTFVFGGFFDREFSEPIKAFFDEINTVNILQGYGKIGIFSPLEVIAYENE